MVFGVSTEREGISTIGLTPLSLDRGSTPPATPAEKLALDI